MENKEQPIEMPFYLMAESISDVEKQIKVNIFNCNLEELMFEKMYLLFEKYNPAVEELKIAKMDLQEETERLLLNTNFEDVLGKKRTNKEEREAYINTCVEAINDRIDDHESTVRFYKAKLDVINDLINTRRLELKIETNLQEGEI